MEKAAVFIDGGYIEKVCLKDFHGARINYSIFPRLLVDRIPDTYLYRTYYFDSLPYQDNPPTQEQSIRLSRKESFFASLQRLDRFEVVQGKLAKRYDANGVCRFEQKMVDMLLGLHVVRLSAQQSINHVVLVAGDSDFVPAIRLAKEDGVDVYLFHGATTCHHELWQICDERIKIDQALIDASAM